MHERRLRLLLSCTEVIERLSFRNWPRFVVRTRTMRTVREPARRMLIKRICRQMRLLGWKLTSVTDALVLPQS